MQVSSQVQVLTLQVKVKSFCCKGQIKSSHTLCQVSLVIKSYQVTHRLVLQIFFFNSGTFITLFRHRGLMGYENK